MRRILSNLFRGFRTTSTARGGRQTPRRVALQVEGLEDRMVLSTASLTGSTVRVIVDQPSQQIASTVATYNDATPTTPTTTIIPNEFTIKK